MSIYYEIKNDLKRYPEAWCFLIWSARGGSFGAGKTYGTLKYLYENKIKFIYIKRTNDDVKFICSDLTKSKVLKDVDRSPFKSLNRDLNINVRAFKIDKGFGAFWNCSDDNEPVGEPIGYIVSLNIAEDIKGFDLSDADVIFFDEFIPQRFERVTNKLEGESLLSIYKTVERDRAARGRDTLKLIGCANGSDISNPLFNTLEVINDVATMSSTTSDLKYVKNRGIVLHSLFWNVEKKKLQGLDKAMYGTKWFENNVQGGFTYNDFSNVKKSDLKHMTCKFKLIYNGKNYFLYENNNKYYFSSSRSNNYEGVYDLTFDNDQRKFYLDWVIDLQNYCTYDKVKFESYDLYDLIINYKKFYKIQR